MTRRKVNKRKVLILDTSVLCCWLKIPGREEAGVATDRWDYTRVDSLLNTEVKQGSTIVLPLATLIETGNHIAQAPHSRYSLAYALVQHLRNAVDANSPWAAFTEQSSLWENENLALLAETWPSLADQKISIGDATIKDVAEYYACTGCRVEILTGDRGLKAYEPSIPVPIPRRRR